MNQAKIDNLLHEDIKQQCNQSEHERQPLKKVSTTSSGNEDILQWQSKYIFDGKVSTTALTVQPWLNDGAS